MSAPRKRSKGEVDPMTGDCVAAFSQERGAQQKARVEDWVRQHRARSRFPTA